MPQFLVQEALLSSYGKGRLSPASKLLVHILKTLQVPCGINMHKCPISPGACAVLPIFKSLATWRGTSLKLNGETSLHIRNAAASPLRVSLAFMRFLGKDRIL